LDFFLRRWLKICTILQPMGSQGRYLKKPKLQKILSKTSSGVGVAYTDQRETDQRATSTNPRSKNMDLVSLKLKFLNINKGIFLDFFSQCPVFKTASSAAPLIPQGCWYRFETRTVATSALAARTLYSLGYISSHENYRKLNPKLRGHYTDHCETNQLATSTNKLEIF
jgi:hypothetical protein